MSRLQPPRRVSMQRGLGGDNDLTRNLISNKNELKLTSSKLKDTPLSLSRNNTISLSQAKLPAQTKVISNTQLRSTRDPRPLSSKQWQENAIARLAEYLVRRGYPHSIGTSALRKPTQAEFTNIMKFLLQDFDPDLVHSKKIEEDILGVFKATGYPYSLTKSTLCSINSPNTWTQILGALSWLTDGLIYMEEKGLNVKHVRGSNLLMIGGEGDRRDGRGEGEEILSGHLREYLQRTYQIFMETGSKNFMALDMALRKIFDETISEEILMADREETALQLVESKTRDLERIGVEEMLLGRNLMEAEREIVEQSRKVERLERGGAERDNFLTLGNLEAEAAQLETAIKEANARVSEIEIIISTQSLSVEEFDDLIMQVERLEQRLGDMETALTNVSGDIATVRDSCEQHLRTLQSNMITLWRQESLLGPAINSAGVSNHVSPEYTQLIQHRPNFDANVLNDHQIFNIFFDTNHNTPSSTPANSERDIKMLKRKILHQILNFDWYQVIHPALQDIITKLKAFGGASQVKLEESMRDYAQLERRVETLREECQWKQKAVQRLLETGDLDQKEFQQQLLSKETDIENLTNSANDAIVRMRQDIRLLETDIQTYHSQYHQKRESANESVVMAQNLTNQACELMRTFENSIMQLLHAHQNLLHQNSQQHKSKIILHNAKATALAEYIKRTLEKTAH